HSQDHGHEQVHDAVAEAQVTPPALPQEPVVAAPESPVGHDEHAHDAPHDEEHAQENAAHADDSPHAVDAGEEYAAAPVEDHGPATEGDEAEDDDEDDAEEEVVESVGGDDVLEEVPERPFRPRRQYKIQEVIKRRQVMLVQVVKEERGNKGAALTTYLSLAGRYAVLMPNTARGGGISRKITSAQDRSRLKEVVQDLDVPEGMGIILRTAGAARTKPEIKRDFEYLIRMWETVRDMTLKSQAPTLVYEEGSLIKRSLRDLYNKEIDEISVAGEAGYREARDFMKMLMPANVSAVRQYRDGQPLFSRMGVESQLDAMFSPTVQLRSGGYIVINQTEALVSIDVNSGRSTREHHIEDTALKTNLEASEEVARQLRLRDLAGLIVIDFIDMEEKRNNRSVEKKLNECLKNDRARIQVGRISPFGLLEMSRQRIRTGVLESSSVLCPHCGGAGHVRATPSVALHILRSVEETLIKGATHNLCVRTRPQVAFYILNQKRPHLRELEERFGVVISVVADEHLTGQTVFAVDRMEPVAPRAEPRPAAATVRIDAIAPIDEPEDADDVEEADETEEREQAAEPPRGESGERPDRPERPGEDGGRRRRRRRRRGRGGEPREERLDAAGAPEGAGAEDELNGDEETSEGEAAERAQDAAPPRAEGSDERPRGRRDRHRRGRDRWRDREDRGRDGREPRPEAGASEAPAEAAAPEFAPEFAREFGHEPRGEEPVAADRAAEAPFTEAAPARAPAEAAAVPNGADVPQAPEEPARPSAPEPEPVAVVLTPPDPDRPKRAGWWSKAKAALGGS
ncbi:MAG: ribonuclease E/G, partial [Microvirga sp.]